jgi:hypothetical protein
MPSHQLRPLSGLRQLTTRSPKAGDGGANSTPRTLPFAPVRIPFSIHLPSLLPGLETLLVEAEGSSQTLTVRS